MEGTMSAPPLADVGFLYVWDGRPLGELFEFTKTTMPPNEVGSLSDAQIADLLAAVLAGNAYPAGTAELPADPAALAAITILREQ
jgi:quinoprotein glucose dehydrogenase